MTNPLLQPDDRFRRPALPTGDENPFADRPPDPNAPAVESPRIEPQPGDFVNSYPHRGWTILTLAIAAFLAVILSSLAFTGGPPWLVVFSIFALLPALFAWQYGISDLKAMELGAMDRDGEQLTQIGMWLGAAGLVLGLLMLAASLGILVLFISQFF